MYFLLVDGGTKSERPNVQTLNSLPRGNNLNWRHIYERYKNCRKYSSSLVEAVLRGLRQPLLTALVLLGLTPYITLRNKIDQPRSQNNTLLVQYFLRRLIIAGPSNTLINLIISTAPKIYTSKTSCPVYTLSKLETKPTPKSQYICDYNFGCFPLSTART